MLKQLAGQTAIYGVGTIVPRFLNYLLFPYLTRLMTTGEYGVVTDLYALIPFALVVLTMGLETGYFRFAGQAATERERKEVFETTWGAVSLFALLFFAAALLFTPALARITDYAEHPSYIRLTAAIIALDAATAIPFARLRQQGRAKRFVALRLLSVAVNLAQVCTTRHSAQVTYWWPTYWAARSYGSACIPAVAAHGRAYGPSCCARSCSIRCPCLSAGSPERPTSSSTGR